MMGFKFDEEKVVSCINAYFEEHKTKPYMILSSETKKYLPWGNNIFSITSSALAFNDSNATTGIWNGAKIMIDDDLKFGEIFIK